MAAMRYAGLLCALFACGCVGTESSAGNAGGTLAISTGGDPDVRLELGGFDIEAADGVDDPKPGPDRPLGIILMRPRVAEIDQDAVAHVFRDKAVKVPDEISDAAVIRSDHLAQILGIEPRRKLGRADEVAEHNRQLPALRFHPHPSLPRIALRGRVREGPAAARRGKCGQFWGTTYPAAQRCDRAQ